MQRSSIVWMVVLSACAGAPAKPQALTPGDYSYAVKYGTWLVDKQMREAKVQGLSVALIDDQKVVWAQGFGLADRAAGLPATADTVYRIGTLSELLTVTAALQLADEGKLALDRPLVDYVPDFAIRSRFPSTPPVTLRQLMTQHSGLPAMHLQGMWAERPRPLSDLPGLVRDEDLAFVPGEVWDSSNLGVALLGLAVQNVAGEPFDVWVGRNLLSRLQMSRSSFAPGDPLPDQARSYVGSEERAEPGLRDVPAAGMRSSVRDMAQFVRMLLAEGSLDGRRVLSPESVQQMLRPQNSDVPLDLSFRVGLGWALGGLGEIAIPQAKSAAHYSGASLFQHGQIIVLPEEKLGIVVLANTAGTKLAVNTVATEVLSLALETKTGARAGRPEPPGPGPSLSAEELRAYEGTWATFAGRVDVVREGERLTARAFGRSVRLVPRIDTRLQIQYRALGFIPVDLGELGAIGLKAQDIGGHHVLGAALGDQEMLVGERLVPAPVTEAWRRRLGRYQVVNAEADAIYIASIQLREEDGFLVMDTSQQGAVGGLSTSLLRTVSDDEAVVAGLWFGTGATLRAVAKAGRETLRFSGYELERFAEVDPGGKGRR